MTSELVPWRGHNVPVITGEVTRASLTDWFTWVAQAGNYGMLSPPTGVTTTYGARPAEPIATNFPGFVEGLLYRDGPVAAITAYRLRVFAQASPIWQKVVGGLPADLHDDEEALYLLRHPWPAGSTGDLMKRSLLYGDFGGTAYLVRIEDELVVLRPDWVEFVLAARTWQGVQVGWKQIGIAYYEGGFGVGSPAVFMPGEYATFIPFMPDPLASYRGLSWLTPIIREVMSDKAATDHKLAFFENAATPNLAVSLPKEITPTQFAEFVDKMDAQHKGALNAYKTLYTAGGADVTVVGANMQQMDFGAIQGKIETRIANGGGIHAVLVGFSEGMQGSSLNAGNYQAAKRNTADTTMRDLWKNWSTSCEALFPPPGGSRLWYIERDIPFLDEDAKDQAEIQAIQHRIINSDVMQGFEAQSSIASVSNNDVTLLKHSGLVSVQLLPPGQQADGAAPDVDGDGVPDDGPIDFGALRSDLFDDDDIERRYNPSQARVPKGFEGGGRFRSLTDRLTKLLDDWGKGEGPDDPLDDFDREQLRKTSKALADRARADGDEDRAKRLTPRRGASSDEIKLALYTDVRAKVRGDRDVAKPSAKFTLQGKPDPAKVRDVEVENKIRAAYGRVPVQPGGWVKIRDLRAELGDVDRHELDAAFIRMGRERGTSLLPEENQKVLTPADREAAVMVGPTPNHFLLLEDPSPRPVPKPLRDLDVAVYRDKDGKPALYREDESGKRGALVEKFDSLAALEKWAGDNDEPRLAEWARKEQGGPAAKKTAPAKKATKMASAHEAILSHDPEGPAGPTERLLRELAEKEGIQLGAKKAPAKKATPRKAAGTAGRERQAAADAARTVGDTAAELDEMVSNGASTRALKHRVNARGKQGLPDAVRDDLLAAIDSEDVENRIRAAYAAIRKRNSDSAVEWVGLAELRDELGESVNRHEVDRALLRLLNDRGNRLIPEENQKTITAADHDAAIDVSGEPKHLISMADPSPRSDKVRAATARAMKASNLTPIGTPGDVVPFDRKLHTSVSPGMREGQPVRIVRPGYDWTHDGKTVPGEKAAVVEPDAPSVADAPDLSNLTTRQKRARLKALGFTPEQIDELAPTLAMQKKARG